MVLPEIRRACPAHCQTHSPSRAAHQDQSLISANASTRDSPHLQRLLKLTLVSTHDGLEYLSQQASCHQAGHLHQPRDQHPTTLWSPTYLHRQPRLWLPILFPTNMNHYRITSPAWPPCVQHTTHPLTPARPTTQRKSPTTSPSTTATARVTQAKRCKKPTRSAKKNTKRCGKTQAARRSASWPKTSKSSCNCTARRVAPRTHGCRNCRASACLVSPAGRGKQRVMALTGATRCATARGKRARLRRTHRLRYGALASTIPPIRRLRFCLSSRCVRAARERNLRVLALS